MIDPRHSAVLRRQPFEHVVHNSGALLPIDTVAQLMQTFPHDRLTERWSRPGGDKSYRVRTSTLYDAHGPTALLADLPLCWRDVVGAITATAYGSTMADLLKLTSVPARWEIRLSEYSHGGCMSRHTDRPDKLFSQNIYLCPRWEADWGGELALYDGPASAHPVVVFPPGPGVSLAFARSDHSWHEVRHVSQACQAPRRALLVHAYRGTEIDHAR